MAYTATVTTDTPYAERATRSLAILSGNVNVTEYHATLAAITDITKHFRALKVVEVCNPTDEGYMLVWNSSSNAFKAYKGDYSVSVDGPLVEASNATDVGAADFVAIGIVAGR